MRKGKVLLLGVICLLLVGCGTKSKNKEESKETTLINNFEEVSTKNEFIFLDNKGAYPDDKEVVDAKKAILDDVVVEMVIYKDNKSAEKAQDKQIKDYKEEANESAKENKKEGKNSYKYILEYDDFYIVSSRIDNTVVFCRTVNQNKKKVDAILKELKY